MFLFVFCDNLFAILTFRLHIGLCLIQAESGADTTKIGYEGAVTKYGLFQIDGTEWCGLGYQGGKCKVDCRGEINDIPPYKKLHKI